jgi:hypothetical protein
MKTFIDMRNISLIMLLLLIMTSGQANSKEIKNRPVDNRKLQEYVGTYKTNDEKSCSIDLTITLKTDGLHYKIKTKTRNKEGRIKITKMGKEIYINFIGLRGDKPKNQIEGLYEDHQITIQNDGNAMNRYTNFGECDLKYIVLEKLKK